MAIYTVDDMIVDSVLNKFDEDVIMMSVCVAGNEGKLVKFLEEFFCCFASLLKESNLILSIGFLIFVSECGFTFCLQSSHRSPVPWGYCLVHNFVNEVGCKLFW